MNTPTIHPESAFTLDEIVMKWGLSAIERGYLERSLDEKSSDPLRYRGGRNVTRYKWTVIHQALIELGVLE